MIKLPNLEKSANLIIELSHKKVVAKLVYTDYSISRHYVFSDIVTPARSTLSTAFFIEYLKNLEKLFDWQFFRNGSDQVMPLVNEGFGLDSLSFLVDSRVLNKKECIEIIRGVSNDISILFIDNTYIQDLLLGIGNRLGYDDVVLVDMGYSSTQMYRISRQEGSRRLDRPVVLNDHLFKHGRVGMENEWKVIDSVYTAKVRAFLSLETPLTRLSNVWSNYILGEKKGGESRVIKDLLRSFNTLQMLTLRNDNTDTFERIGSTKYSTLLLVTGDIVNQLNYADILLTLIDGLEINDVCDIALDTTSSVYTLGKVYANGIAKSGYLSEFNDFISRLDQILIPDVSKDGDRKRSIFTATVSDVNGNSKDVYALSNEITQILIDTDVDIQEIHGEFIKGSSLYSEFKYNLVIGKKKYNSVVIDSRYRPIVYGPDPKSNQIKMSNWVNATIT